MEKKEEKGNFDFVKDLKEQVEEKKRRFEGVYVIDPEKYKQFIKVLDYFKKLASENDGKVSSIDFEPESINASISIDVPMVDLPHDALQKFLEAMDKIDVFSTTQTESGSLLVNASVNNVWKAVPKE